MIGGLIAFWVVVAVVLVALEQVVPGAVVGINAVLLLILSVLATR